jgi:hypothetical protein
MLGVGGKALEDLEAAIRQFRAREQRVDLKGLRALIDSLELEFALEARRLQAGGDHLVEGNITAVSWIARTCSMSATSAADRLCVGEQLESLPRIACALSSGEVGYQSVSVLCHLREQLGDKRDLFNEEEMLELAQKHSVSTLRYLCRYARHVADPEGFQRESEEDFTRRRLHISQLGDGMHAIDGILDPEGGAAIKTALESLARRLGPGDERSRSQRMADSLVELAQHAMDQGRLPRRNGVKPHLSVTTTLEGLKNELGAPAADLELAMPISTRSVERLACDGAVSRVLLQDSLVIDVGRATRVVSAPTRRALRVRDKGCRWPGCERPIGWSTPHHIVAWSRGGDTNLNNLILLCHHHHRLVHEGGWQVVKTGREFRFVPPERAIMRRARGPGLRWAA